MFFMLDRGQTPLTLVPVQFFLVPNNRSWLHYNDFTETLLYIYVFEKMRKHTLHQSFTDIIYSITFSDIIENCTWLNP